MKADTIAAIATAAGEGGISIIRISGPDATAIADRVFCSSGAQPSNRPDRSVVHGKITDGKRILDEVILLIMRAPHSYTREDVVEIQTHGGTLSARRVLRCVLENGAVAAGSGEFTRRAFMNGRIDLLQAEAVLDLVRSVSDKAAQSALEQLEGRLSGCIASIYSSLSHIIPQLEALLDFDELDPHHDLVPHTIKSLEAVSKELCRLIASWEQGHVLREGANTVITGRPNAGKSSLLNALLGKDRAIVSPTPGTTRDTIEEVLVIDGIPFRLTDTAGLRTPKSKIEEDGVSRAMRHAEAADIRIHVVDGSTAGDSDEIASLRGMDSKRTIVALNKSDLACLVQPEVCSPFPAIRTSCVSGDGLDELKRALVEMAGFGACLVPVATISERHRRILQIVEKSVTEATNALRSHGEIALPVTSSLLRDAAEKVGTMIGKRWHEDMLDAIFSRFCIGK